MRKIIAAAVIVAAIPMTAMAESGDKSLGLFAMMSNSDAGDMTMVSVQYGQFLSDSIELNAGASISDSAGTSTVSINVLGDYFFSTGGAVAPFVGAGVNATSGDIDYTAIVVEGGMRMPVGEDASFEVKLQRVEPLDDQYSAAAHTDLLAGLRINF